MTETKEYREGFRYMFRKKTDIPAERFNRILQYRGFGEGDIWIDDEPGTRIQSLLNFLVMTPGHRNV